MIQKLLQFCLRERLLILMIAIAVAGYGWYSTQQVPLDAIPNVGDNQVIVLTEWKGRSPKDVEDQITYPLSIALQAVPGASSVRGKSMFGFSFVQVTFDDDVDFYWARSRVAEQLSSISRQLPEDVVPTLGPDATALGQIYYYVLEPPEGMGLEELRTKQDYFIKYSLQSVEGVAEVASIGGYVRQYQVEVDPDLLRYHNVTLNEVIGAVDAANIEVGAKSVESGGMEFIVRGKGFIGAEKTETDTIREIENTVIQSTDGVPIRVSDVAQIQTGPAFRRGALDFNGAEAVGGVVVMQYGQNPRELIKRVKEKVAALEPDLDGIKIRGVYDRTLLIDETVATLSGTLGHEILITIAVMLLFLLHIRASIVIAITLPMAVLISFIAMNLFGVDANIMSLAGIAIAIGTMVDMGIIVLENVYAGLADWEKSGAHGGQKGRLTVIRESAGEVIPAVVTAVSTTIVSFVPVFFLTGRDARLFTPLAWTKTFALAASLIVAVTLVPLLCRIFLRSNKWSAIGSTIGSVGGAIIGGTLAVFVWGDALDAMFGLHRIGTGVLGCLAGAALGSMMSGEKTRTLEGNPVSRCVTWLYSGRLRFALKHKAIAMVAPAIILVIGLGAWKGLPQVLRPVDQFCEFLGADLDGIPGYASSKESFPGLESDDWIALDEGSWFYMPSLYPAASFSQAMEVLQTQDALIKKIPEVDCVLGKIGRVDSALDPAPAAMVETYVMLKPRNQWRKGVTPRDVWNEINEIATIPGVTPASPLQPIEGRVVMLQSGIKASMAVRIFGDDLDGLSDAAREVAEHLKRDPHVNGGTVSPDIVMGKPYLEFEIDREEAARYGMTTSMVNQVVAAGLGGVDVTTTYEGRERNPIQLRYQRDVRERIDQLPELPVVTHAGEVVPLGQLASVKSTWGPGVINSEDARLVAHVSFSPSGIKGDIETVDAVMASLELARNEKRLDLPKGNFEFQPVGSFEHQVKSNQRLLWLGPLLEIDDPKQIASSEDRFAWVMNRIPLGLVPLALVINFCLLYLSFRRFSLALVVFSAIPVAFAGGMIAVAIAGIDMNTAIWVGFIALFGIAVDDGVLMATYMQREIEREPIRNVDQLREVIYQAGRRRIRPCVMTTVTTLAALLPVLLATGRGADVARAMAIPVFGGMLVEPFTTFVVPTLYCWYLEIKTRLRFFDRATPTSESDLATQSEDEQPRMAA